MTTKLYDVDFSQWAIAQAEHLRNEEYAELDLNNLIEEIEDMSRSESRALESDLFVLLRHLLKLSFLPDGAPSRGWQSTVKEHRYRIQRLIKKNPSLRPIVSNLIAELYIPAADVAITDLTPTEIAGRTFLDTCPWSTEQVLDQDYWP